MAQIKDDHSWIVFVENHFSIISFSTTVLNAIRQQEKISTQFWKRKIGDSRLLYTAILMFEYITYKRHSQTSKNPRNIESKTLLKQKTKKFNNEINKKALVVSIESS